MGTHALAEAEARATQVICDARQHHEHVVVCLADQLSTRPDPKRTAPPQHQGRQRACAATEVGSRVHEDNVALAARLGKRRLGCADASHHEACWQL